ncbi:hypothetical protein FCL49_11085 [Serratia proteamaculans]|uniref:hypothetical protein n=1 Tax=Serratia proteamaculans TaxID=28151 RepID=UPI001575BE70|nr:hypothetical protein [Serratia proteamaculans]NTX79442.1 hypothetical protein [Serratia proteamaculans]NTZ28644.1 hypothetical protein [Serratia proteamaculans]
MINLVMVDSSPWDFTLYKSETGEYIIEIMFSEGEYKIDVARYYHLTHDIDLLNINHTTLTELSKKIRNSPSNYEEKEIQPGDIKVTHR